MSEAIRRDIGDMLRDEVKDPRIGFITITEVTVPDDLQIATVYYTVLGDEKTRKEAKEGLESALGYIRRAVAHRLKIKFAPEIIFRYDETFEKEKKLDEIFDQIHKKKSS